MRRAINNFQLPKKEINFLPWYFIILLIFIFSNGLAQTTIVCTGATGSYNSGTVASTGAKIDGNMTNLISTGNRGWAHFNLSTIPTNATIQSVTINFTTYSSTSSSATNNIYGFTGNPSTIAGATLYTNCGIGNSLNTSTWTANTLQTKVFNTSGIAFIQSKIGTDNANIGFVRGSLNTYNIYGYSGATPPNLVITYTTPSCSGAPTPGNTISSATQACSGSTVNLSIQNTTAGSSVSYQWYNYNALLLGETASTYTHTLTATASLSCAVTCLGSGITTYSNPITITLIPFTNCYCTTTLGGTCNHQSLSFVGISSTPLSNSTSTCTAPYTSFPATGSATASLQIGNTYSMVVSTFSTTSTLAQTGFWIDYNHNSIFEVSEFTRIDSNSLNGVLLSKSFTIPPTALTGQTGMRVRSDYVGFAGFIFADACSTRTDGSTQDYIVTLQNLPCAGIPSPGNTMTLDTNVCVGGTVQLFLQNNTVGLGVSYQWYDTSGIIAGATNATYTTTITATNIFHCNVTCSGNSNSSIPLTITPNFINCYCIAVPLIATDEEIYNVTLNGSSTNPLYSYANGCANAAPGPGSILNKYSNFKTLGILSTITQGIPSSFSVEENECDGATYFGNGMAIWIDYNHNGSFNDPGEQVYTESATTVSPRTVNNTFIAPNTALTGITVMRVIVAEAYFGTGLTPCLNYNYGETEDYLINIAAGVPCAGTPNLGNTLSSISGGLIGSQATLSFQNYISGSGVLYQWYNSIGPIVGATNSSFSTILNTTDLFYCLANCSGNIGSSTPLTINIFNSSLNTYCIPTSAGSACISNVSFANLNNSTPCSGTNFYNFYSSPVASVTKGSVYTFSMTTDADAITSVWIDFDHDGVFATNEWTQIYTTGLSGSQSILIPLSALSGSTIMRVRSRLTGNQNGAADACLAMGSGETEDYGINIMGITNGCVPVITHINTFACNSYTWGATGQTYYASGTYFKAISQTSTPSCVDTIYLHLTLSNIVFTSNVTACGSYVWLPNGVTYTTSGTFTTSLMSTAGCDSILSINLTLYQTTSGSSSVTACNTYTWNGVTYTTSGIATHHYTNIHGCDSLHTLTITINQGPTRSVSASATNTYTWSLNNQTYTTSGTYTQTVFNPVGCDSIISLQLTITQVGVSMTLQHIVQTAPNIFEYDIILANTGNIPILLQGYSCGINHANGMRGTGTLTHTFVSRDPALSAIPAITPGYTSASNHLRFISGNATIGNEAVLQVGTSYRIATMRVTNSVNYPADFNPAFTLQTLAATGKTQCLANITLASSSYAINGIGNIAQANTLQALTGVVNTPCLYLSPSSVFAASTTSANPVTCYGMATGNALITLSGLGSAAPGGTSGIYTLDSGSEQNYSSNPFNIQNLVAGIHTLFVRTSYGCADTAIVVITQPLTPLTSSSSYTACQSYVWNGITYTNTGSYTHTYTTIQGCDSVHTLQLTIHANPIVTADNVTKCIGSSVNLVGNPLGGTFSLPSPYSGGSTTYTYTFTNNFGCVATSTPALISVAGCNATLNLTLYLQGYYTGNGLMQSALFNEGISSDTLLTDSIIVELHSLVPPYSLVASRNVILQKNGSASATFNYTPSLNFIGGSFYIAIKHRSGLTTWSANPITFSTNTINYNFSILASNAFGDNQIEVEPGVWAIYNGDLNGDENIDLLDNPILENDITSYSYGYFASDLNGDGNVDLLDVPILEWGIFNFIFSIHP